MYCLFCGSEISESDEYCSVCGEAVQHHSEEKQHLKRSVTIRIPPFVLGLACAVAVLGVIMVIILTLISKPVINDDYSTDLSNSDYETEAGLILPETTEQTTVEYSEPSTTVAETTAYTTREFTARTTTQPIPHNDNPPYVTLTSDLQYDVNIFLSNFSESELQSFTDIPSDYELAEYAVSYNIINRFYLFEDGEFMIDKQPESFNYRISESDILQTINKYFNVVRQPGFVSDYMYYDDGYFYVEMTGGYLYSGFTVVTDLKNLGNNHYLAYFDIYEDGAGGYDYYGYSSAQISRVEDVYYVGHGNAIISAENIYDRSTYYLEQYTVDRR